MLPVLDEATHTYRIGDLVVPGVTSVLGGYDGLEFVDRLALETARIFGRHVHQACHLDNIGALDESSLTESMAAYLEGWRRFRRESGFVVLSSEELVYHPAMRYAGTLDAVGMFPGKARPALLDIKTGDSAPRTVGPQTAAYNEAREGDRLPRFCCLLKPGGYSLIALKDPRDFDIFKAALTLYRWRTNT